MTMNVLEMNDNDLAFARRMAAQLGFENRTAYTSSSDLTGLFCLPANETQKKGCIIKTESLGFLWVQDLEDLKFWTLAEEQREQWGKEQKR